MPWPISGATCMPDSPPRCSTSRTRRYPASGWQQLKQSLAAHSDQQAIEGSGLYHVEHSHHQDILGAYHLGSYQTHVDQDTSSVTENLHHFLLVPEGASDIMRRAISHQEVPMRVQSGVAECSCQIQSDGSISSSSWHSLHSSVLQDCPSPVGVPLTAHHCRVSAASIPTPRASAFSSTCRQSLLNKLKQHRQQVHCSSLDPTNHVSNRVSNPIKQRSTLGSGKPVSRSCTRSSVGQSEQSTVKRPATCTPKVYGHLGSSQMEQRQHLHSGYHSSLGNKCEEYGQTIPTSSNRPRSASVCKDSKGGTDHVPQVSPGCLMRHQHQAPATDGSGLSLASIQGPYSSLLRSLQQDLSLQLSHRVLRRWQQATADVLLEKAHARPMRNLLSKRKALRAWCTAKQQRLGCDKDHLAQSLTGQQSAAAHQELQPGPVPYEACADAVPGQQQALQQMNETQNRHYKVAAQFHRLYKLHSCFGIWWQQAVTGVLQRVREEQNRLLQEQQARVLKQQQEQQQRQHQQQMRQQEEHKAAVAANFHRLYVLYRTTTVWHQQAAMSAALNKLFPDQHRAAVGAQGNNRRQPVIHSSLLLQSVGNDRLHAAALIQCKAQQLLEKLAAKQAGQTQQQPTQRVKAETRHVKLHPHPELQQQHQVVLEQGQEQINTAVGADYAAEVENTPDAYYDKSAAAPCTAEVSVADDSGVQQLQDAGASAAWNAQTMQSDAAIFNPQAVASVHKESAAAPAAECGHALTAAASASRKQGVEQAPQHPECEGIPQHMLEAGHLQQCKCHTEQVQGVHEQPHDLPTVSCEAAGQQVQQQEQIQQECCAKTVTDASSTGHAPEQQQQWQQQQQQQQQQQWLHDRQQLHQQFKRLTAVEQCWHHQQQKLEQQLQTEIAEEQALLAELHYNLMLAQRLGLTPWKKMMQLNRKRFALASDWRRLGLLRAGLFVWKLLLVHRRKRRVCCHVRAIGKLCQVQQQQQQSRALCAWLAWVQASRHHSSSLLHRFAMAWRTEWHLSLQRQGVAQEKGDRRIKRQTLGAWGLYVEQQVQEQLLLEMELTETAEAWQRNWWQQRVLTSWRAAAVAAVQDRHIEARRQEAWVKIRGWLAECDSTKQKPSTVSSTPASIGSLEICAYSGDSDYSWPLHPTAACSTVPEDWRRVADAEDACTLD